LLSSIDSDLEASRGVLPYYQQKDVVHHRAGTRARGGRTRQRPGLAGRGAPFDASA
jgi:hypothetical protein